MVNRQLPDGDAPVSAWTGASQDTAVSSYSTAANVG